MNEHYRCTAKLVLLGLIGVLYAVFLIGCSGGEVFSDKQGELEARATLSDIKQVRANPNVNKPLPVVYFQPPKRVNVADGVKLFYFTKQLPAAQLATIITEQLAPNAQKTNDPAKGADQHNNAYKVTVNEATNQLIIHCPDDEAADKVLEFLKAVDLAPIQVNIDCMIVELYADKTMDRETTTEIEDLFGENIAMNGTLPGSSLRETKRSTFGVDIGYSSDKINLLVDALVSKGYLKILMNPTLETVNGRKAKVLSKDDVPIEKVVTNTDGDVYSITEYQWVEDSLQVTPYVFADGSVGLNTEIKIGSSTKPKGVVQASIITERSITVEENRIKPGNSLIIGGIRRTEKRDVLRGVPFFKDIPVVGLLFSSRDFEESGTELIFILTPSISSGGIEYAKMLDFAQKKQSSPQYDSDFEEALTDPFGEKAYTEHVKQKAAEATTEKALAEAETAKTHAEAEKTKMEAEQATAEAAKAVALAAKAKADAETEKALAAKLQAESSQAQTEAAKAKAEADNAKSQAEKARADAETDKLETEKIKANSERAQAQAEQAQAEAEKARAAAEKAQAQASQAQAEADKAKAESETAKANAQQIAAEAEKAKADAERERTEAEREKAEAERARQQAAQKDSNSNNDPCSASRQSSGDPNQSAKK